MYILLTNSCTACLLIGTLRTMFKTYAAIAEAQAAINVLYSGGCTVKLLGCYLDHYEGNSILVLATG